MTIQEVTPRIQYVGDGVQEIFSFAFPLVEGDDLTVTVDGVSQVLNTDYIIVNLTSSGGDVDFNISGPPADQSIVLFVRETDLDQETVYTPFDPFPAKSHEGALDKLTMQIQDLSDEVNNVTADFMSKGGSLLFWEAENLLISNVLDPASAQDAATKAYVDANIGSGDLNGADDEVITGMWTFTNVIDHTNHINLANDFGLRGKDIGGTNRNLIKILSNDIMQVGNSSSDTQYTAMGLHNFINAPMTVHQQLTMLSPPSIDGLLWPIDKGNDGQALVTDGSSLLRWATLGSGGTGVDPTANETISGQWTFSQTILGTTDGNLVPADLVNIAELDANETVTGQWSFAQTILGTTDGNITNAQAVNFADRTIAQSITGNWDFTQNILFKGSAGGGLTIAADDPFNASLSMDILAGPQGNLTQNAGGFAISPESVNTTRIYFDHDDKIWNFMGGGAGGNPNVLIQDFGATLGALVMKDATGTLVSVLNRNDDYTINGDWTHLGAQTFNQLIQGECSNNIGSSSDFTVTGTWDFAASPILRNGVALEGNLAGDVAQVNLLQITGSDVAILGNSTINLTQVGLAFIDFTVGGATIGQIVPQADGSMDILDRDGAFRTVGFRGARKWSISSNFSITQVQEDMVIDFNGATAGQTITADTLQVRTNITVKNTSANPVTLGEGTATLLHLDGSGVLPATGNLTLAVGGVANLYWDDNSEVHVWGTGIS